MSQKRKNLSRREFLRGLGISSAGLSLGHLGFGFPIKEVLADALPATPDFDLIYPNSVDPVLSKTMMREIRIPNSCSAIDGQPNLHASATKITPMLEAKSLMGYPITSMRDPYQDLEAATTRLVNIASEREYRPKPLRAAAKDIMRILLGTTKGRNYDGFALLNYNRGAYASDHVANEYKTKRLRDTGETFISEVDGEKRKVWEVDYTMYWYGQNFDSDMYLLRIPFEMHDFDEFRINWRIISLIQEDLAPSTIMNDGFGRIYHGLDSTFETIPSGSVTELTVKYPPKKHIRGLYIWGWGVHPPRVQFLQPVVEINEVGDLNWPSRSFSERCAGDLTIENIADEAPEKKFYNVAKKALDGIHGGVILKLLTDPEYGPYGTYRQWLQAASNQRQLPIEAWERLKEEDGLEQGDFGEYDIILAYMNNEMYGDNPAAAAGQEGRNGVVKDWKQSDSFRVKVMNFDKQTHYYRNVDFSAKLTSENKYAFGNGEFSFEKFSPKPSYGVPKIAEMQWRTGWGYVPHVGVAQQSGLFPREIDRENLTPFLDQFGETFYGYVFKNTTGYFRFDPPEPIRAGEIGDFKIEAGEPLKEADGSDGVLISFDAEAFGTAKMPSDVITTHPDQENRPELTYPGFLKNPSSGGDIIPPTPVWMPFLAMHPETGTLKDPDGNWWVDQTYLHGRPVFGKGSIVANIEAPRAGGQLFYQFDPLFHDNMIFSLHPRSDALG